MKLSPEKFIELILSGKTEQELNRKESDYVDPQERRKLMSKKYGHSFQSATDHLLTDYSDGFTICKCCGSYSHLGNGFTKHISIGCLHCEGEEKHPVYWVNASKPSEGGFPARYMSRMFDNGIHYTKDKLQIGKYKDEVKQIIHP